MTYAGTRVISYGWLSKSSVWHNDTISISLQWRHMNVTTRLCHNVNSRDKLADPDKKWFPSIVVLEWLEWSQWDHRGWLEKPRIQKVFNFVNIYRQTPSNFLTYIDVCRFYLCPSNNILNIKKNILMLMLRIQCKERKPYSNKTNKS